jgi:hypothetical protein
MFAHASLPHPVSARDEILAQLHALVGSVTRESRLEVVAEPVYVLASVGGDKRRVRCQVVSSSYVPREHKLDSEGGARLRALGYAKGGGQRNWLKEIGTSPTELERFADEAVDVLTGLYRRAPGDLSTRLVHDDTAHPENPDLIEAMTRLAGNNTDEQARVAMYNAMLNATFLVPLSPDVDDADDGGEEFMVLERVQGRPVFAVFTDWASLQLWNPRTCPYVPVHGSDLFQTLHDLSLSLLQINPRGNTGGQLFAHEVETLARAMKHWRSKHLH